MIKGIALTLVFVQAGWPAACAAPGGADPRYPPRDEGCDVKIFEDVPPSPTDNLGSVSARCEDVVSEEQCLRRLKDEACRLGADVVWGVPPKPEHKSGKIIFTGRAAHTKR
jgi:hypothetical protein